MIGRKNATSVLVGEAGGRPLEWSREKLREKWTGVVLFITRRDRLKDEAPRFGLAWFLPVVRRFRRILAEVLRVSVFIQLVALAAPSSSQVVIDKVLVHRGLTTLEVLCIGLLVVNAADAALNWLRTYTFAHTTSRMDAILGAQLFQHLLALPIAYFESRQTGRRSRTCANSKTSASSSRPRR